MSSSAESRRSGSPSVDQARLDTLLPAATAAYRTAEPYPHIVLDGFLPADVADRLARDFPPIAPETWINYLHVNERKYGSNDRATFPPSIDALIETLHAPPFVRWLEALTGIAGLLPDSSLEGSGLHQSLRGGHLNVHADFTGHPHRPTWRRRINLLIYLNEGWQDGWAGHLELWSRDVRRCVQRIAPIHNRAVVFSTDVESFHGHPETITCPEDVTRKSIALYYFTDEPEPFVVRSTEYRARPGDGPRAALIYLDQIALRIYDRAKRTFGLDDRLSSRLLRALARRGRR